MKFIETMDMSYSYKPVLLKAIYEYMDTSGRVALPDVVDYFIDFYEDRKATMIAEKSNQHLQEGWLYPERCGEEHPLQSLQALLRICDS